jgi:hypothetical protein
MTKPATHLLTFIPLRQEGDSLLFLFTAIPLRKAEKILLLFNLTVIPLQQVGGPFESPWIQPSTDHPLPPIHSSMPRCRLIRSHA